MPSYLTPFGGSQIARELAALREQQRQAIQVADEFIMLVDGIVTLTKVLSDPRDGRHWSEKLESLFDLLPEEHAGVVATMNHFAQPDSDEIRATVRRIKQHGFKRFARRLVGEASYIRLEKAIQEDSVIVALALKRAVRWAAPLAQALDDAASVLSPSQIERVAGKHQQIARFLKIVMDADSALVLNLMPKLPMGSGEADDDDLAVITDLEIDAFADTLRPLVDRESEARVASLNEFLVRKIHGARHALEFSVDGISQAANSLIELIDRLLREALPRPDVLRWIEMQLPARSKDLTYSKQQDGELIPNKHGEALCFVYGEGPIPSNDGNPDVKPEASLIHEIVALAIVEVRSKLQKLKHADEGRETDRLATVDLMNALEGALVIGLRLGWSFGESHPDTLRGRLEGPAWR